MEEVQDRQSISLAEVKEILGKVEPEDMDSKNAAEMKKLLIKDCGLTEDEAVEIVNIKPTSMAELRSFTFGWKKLILAETLEKMLKIVREHSS